MMIFKCKVQELEFNNWLNDNFIENDDDLYMAKDQGNNFYRHFGQRKDKKLFLDYFEVVYLFCKEKGLTKDHFSILFVRNEVLNNFCVYYDIKEAKYNILQPHNQIYIKIKDFNRNSSKSIGNLKYVKHNEKIRFDEKMNIFGITHLEKHAIIKCRKITELSFDTPENLFK